MTLPTQRQARLMWAALTGLSIAALVALAVGAIWGLGHVLQILAPVIWPLAGAGVLAYLLDPVVGWFERKGLSRKKAIICVFAIALLIVAGVAAIILPQIVSETRDLVSRIPNYARRVEAQALEWADHPPSLVQKFMKWEGTPAADTDTNTPNEALADTNAMPGVANQAPATGKVMDQRTLQTAASWIAKVLPKIGSWLLRRVLQVASWFGLVAGTALIPVYLFYLLLEKQSIRSNWKAYLPLKDSELKTELAFILTAINDHLIAFFRGQVLVGICDGIMYSISFLIIGLPYALLVGLLATVVTMVPFLGALFVAATALLISLAQYGDWKHPLMVVTVVAVVQTIEGTFISPKILGDRVGLHPLTIIIAVMTGTTLLGGLLGGLLAIPLTAAGKVLMYRYVWKKREG